MYEEFYKLRAKPFQLSADSRFFYQSHCHKRAMSYLLYGLQQGEGFIVITGDVGTGKTTLVSALSELLEEQDIVYGNIVTTQIQAEEMIKVVAAEFGLDYRQESKAVLLKSLEEFFIGCARQGKRVLLLVDEAQNLPRKSVEELRMLSNLQYRGRPLLQSFLLGQREFRMVMRSREFEQLRQRVIAAYHLRPLEANETRAYIEHRLRLVGWDNDPLIVDEVFEEIHQFTGGIPRRINVFCDRLFLYACMEELHIIDKSATQTVQADMRDEDLVDNGQIGEIEEMQRETVVPEAPRSSPEPSAASDSRIRELEGSLLTLRNSVEREFSLLRDALIGKGARDSETREDHRLESADGSDSSSKRSTAQKKAAKKKATRKKATRKKATKKTAATKRPTRKKVGRKETTADTDIASSLKLVQGAAASSNAAESESEDRFDKGFSDSELLQAEEIINQLSKSKDVDFIDLTAVEEPSGEVKHEPDTRKAGTNGLLEQTKAMHALQSLERLIKSHK